MSRYELRELPALHRDVRRIFALAPLVMIVLPLAVWLPLDYLAEFLAPEMDNLRDDMRAYQRISNALEFFVGTFVFGTTLAAVRRIGANEDASVGACVREAKEKYGRLLVTVWSAGWRIGLGFLVFIIPGIVLTARYALALPIVAWSEHKVCGVDALHESEELMEGHGRRVLSYGAWGYMMWTCMLMLPHLALVYLALYGVEMGMASAWEYPEWLATLLTWPMHLVAVGVTAGTALIYRDIVAQDADASEDAAPVGQAKWSPILEAAPDPETGKCAVFVVSLLGLIGVAWLIHFAGLLADLV